MKRSSLLFSLFYQRQGEILPVCVASQKNGVRDLFRPVFVDHLKAYIRMDSLEATAGRTLERET